MCYHYSMVKKSSKKNPFSLEREVAEFLRKNPEIEKSLEVFGMSVKEYNLLIKNAKTIEK